MASTAEAGLDVDWLLHSKKDCNPSTSVRNIQQGSVPLHSLPEIRTPELSPTRTPADSSDANADEQSSGPSQQPATSTVGDKGMSTASAVPVSKSQSRPLLAVSGQNNDEARKGSKGGAPAGGMPKKEGRRSSWISSFSSKFSSSTPPPASPRTASGEARSTPHATASPQPSPKVELTNPFNKKEAGKDSPKENKKDDKSTPVVLTHTPPRRPSVLVAAGKETKLDHPGFLSSALRRLSSSTNATMGKGANNGAICPRKVMNIDQNRERIRISEYDQNKLKRVAFCVDVEIAGFASQADEEPETFARPPVSGAQKQSLVTKKDSKDARMKEKGEGAALKNPKAVAEEKDNAEPPKTEAPTPDDKKAEDPVPEDASPPSQAPPPAPTTRKKEKKKRSEAERKERRERKRRHAEANGLVPLELTREEDDSDSSPSTTPPGSSTPRRPMDGPTTDPLRIYKRCCQLRETTVLSRMKEQITKPASTLAEAPGTVAVIDLSGARMHLPDIVTLGDWLAVVPVRKLILDDCGLTDEGVRVILSGLSSCKSAEQARQNRRLPKRLSGKHGVEKMGVIEKLSLKGNPGITNLGWKHIGLFLHMSHSLRAIDLSGLAFPRAGDLFRTSTTTSSSSSNGDAGSKPLDLGALVIRGLSDRLGDRLEELIFSACGLSTDNVRDIVDCAIRCKIRRLGLAENRLSRDALTHVVRYLQSGTCEGLDLGNNDLQGLGPVIADALDARCPLFAISLLGCSLTPHDLSSILSSATKLTNLKFIDLSRNKALFVGDSDAVAIFRRLLPKLQPLKRIHLSEVGMTSDQVIALSEVLPDCPSLAHLSILGNEPLVHAMNSKEEGAQEEACAFFASLMTAVRVSETIIAVEIEVPSADSSEVVKALASQVVAYSLRNMERTTLDEVGVQAPPAAAKEAPEVLLHLVGHMDGVATNADHSEPAPDEDYMIASTGIVKALGVCLETKDGMSQEHSANISPTVSGTTTPIPGGRHRSASKPRNVSLELCESARKIRMRLRPVLIKEDRAGNDDNYLRLFALDGTLQRMIQRFEDEYPETKVSETQPAVNGATAQDAQTADASLMSASLDSNGLSQMTSAEDYFPHDEDAPREELNAKLSRASSTTSLVAKAITDEEGRMHRFGQSMRRELLKPVQTDDNLHGTHADDPPEPPHLAAIRAKLETMKGEEIRAKVEHDGADTVIRELDLSAQELLALRENDPAGFEAFKESQLAAQINAGVGGEEHR